MLSMLRATDRAANNEYPISLCVNFMRPEHAACGRSRHRCGSPPSRASEEALGRQRRAVDLVIADRPRLVAARIVRRQCPRIAPMAIEIGGALGCRRARRFGRRRHCWRSGRRFAAGSGHPPGARPARNRSFARAAAPAPPRRDSVGKRNRPVSVQRRPRCSSQPNAGGRDP